MLNNIVIMGRLTKDSELKTLQFGSILDFTLASNRNYKDKSGNYPTDFVKCKIQRDAYANSMVTYLKKGTLVAVQGSLRVDNVNGTYYTYIVVDQVNLVDKAPTNTIKEEPKQDKQTTIESNKKYEPSFMDFDFDMNDIPFN